MDRKTTGALGEKEAQEYLKSKGYQILARNFKRKWGELDIVAKKKRVIVFCEVKTIREINDFHPIDEITPKKQRQLSKMARIYLSENKFPADTAYQIDIIGVITGHSGDVLNIEHLENVIEDNY